MLITSDFILSKELLLFHGLKDIFKESNHICKMQEKVKVLKNELINIQ